MSRVSLFCAAIALAGLAASAPAKADPFHLIRWSDTGFCQIWDNGIPTAPGPGNYAIVSVDVPTFLDALNVKSNMLATGACTL
jgi:hypothetical protein